MDSSYGPYILIILLTMLSAFFSGSEIAYSSANKKRLKKASETKKLKPSLAYYIIENYEQALSTILIGNNLVNIAASSVATVIALSIAGEAGAAYATLIMTIIILIFGEITPKVYAKTHSDAFATAVSVPLRILMIITKPIVIVVMMIIKVVSRLWGGNTKSDDTITEDELLTIIETVEDEGVIQEDRSELLKSAIEFSDISAQEILTPRVDMVAIDIDDDMDVILATINTSPYSRIPVYEKSIDKIIGVLYINHYLKKAIDTEKVSIRSILMEACFVHKSLKLPVVLSELRRRKMHLAVVIDEYGGTMGILTMEDVLEQLVGEIWDETDEITSEFDEVGPNLYEARGDLSIYDFFEYLEVDEDMHHREYTTVGGWAIEMIKRFPNVGDSFEYKNMNITIKEMDDLRVKKVSVAVNNQMVNSSQK